MRSLFKILLLGAVSAVSMLAQPTPVNGGNSSGGAVASVYGRTGSVSAQAGDYVAYYLSLSGGNTLLGDNSTAQAWRILRTDLASGTALSIGTHYYDALTANRTFTFSGTPANGSSVSMLLLVSNAPTLTIPSCKRIGQANSAITSLALSNGVHILSFVYIGSTWYLTDSVPGLPSQLSGVSAAGFLTVDASGNVTGSKPLELVVALSDEATAITTGTAKVTMRAPRAMTIVGVRASLNTASSSGIPTVDINEAGTTIMASVKLTIDASELTSVSAATPAVVSDTSIADDAELTFDIDVAGTGAKGLKVTIYYF